MTAESFDFRVVVQPHYLAVEALSAANRGIVINLLNNYRSRLAKGLESNCSGCVPETLPTGQNMYRVVSFGDANCRLSTRKTYLNDFGVSIPLPFYIYDRFLQSYDLTLEAQAQAVANKCYYCPHHCIENRQAGPNIAYYADHLETESKKRTFWLYDTFTWACPAKRLRV